MQEPFRGMGSQAPLCSQPPAPPPVCLPGLSVGTPLPCLWALEAIQYSLGGPWLPLFPRFSCCSAEPGGAHPHLCIVPDTCPPALGSHGPRQLPKPFLPQVSACCLLCLGSRLPPHATTQGLLSLDLAPWVSHLWEPFRPAGLG